MDKLDQEIRDFLSRQRGLLPAAGRPGAYPDADDFYRFVADELEGPELEKMLGHLKAHPEDQALVAKARELAGCLEEASSERVSPEALRRAESLLASRQGLAVCPHCGKPVTPFKKPLGRQRLQDLGWAALAAASFGLSFVFARYFFQFLVVAALAGVKAIVDARATKTQILIYKALREDESVSAKDLHRVSSHL